MTQSPTLIRTALWIVATWWLAHLLLIAGHVLVVFLYSALVAPGLENADYQAFAMRSGPWYSIVAGGPVFYLFGRVLVRRVSPRQRASGLIVWALYSATDAAIVILSLGTVPALLAGQWVVSQGVKLAAILLATPNRA